MAIATIQDCLTQAIENIDRQDSAPLHAQIGANLKRLIESGELPPGEELPPQGQLCELFEVSKITITRAIRDLASEGLLTTRPGSGTRVCYPAEQLRRPANVLPPLARPGALHVANIISEVGKARHPFGGMYLGLQDELEENSAVLHIIRLPTLADSADQQADLIDVRAYSGLILQTSVNLRLVVKAQSESIPYILVGNELADRASHCVSLNEMFGVMEAMAHFSKTGRKRVGVVTGLPHKFRTWRVLDAFEMARRVYGFETSDKWAFSGEYTEEAGYEAIEKFLQTSPRPDAVFFASDYQAKGGLMAAEEMGVAVPDELAVIGMGKNLMAREAPMDLTTVDTMSYQMGQLTVRTLMRLIRGDKDTPYHQSLSPELYIGETA